MFELHRAIRQALQATHATQAVSTAAPQGQSRPALSNSRFLAITSLDEAPGYLVKLATLVDACGARLRLAYGPNRSLAYASPLARLKQRARYLGRLLDRGVETVDVEIGSPKELRRHLVDCAVVCIAKPTRTGPPGPGDADFLNSLLAFGGPPVLIVEPGEGGQYANTLVPVSLGPNSPQLLRWARVLAPDSAIEVLHVTDLPKQSYSPQPLSVVGQALELSRAVLQHRLSALSGELADRKAASRQMLTYGDVAEEIERRQIGEGHGLVVVGISARGRWLQWLRPVLAHKLAGRLHSDMLVVPQPSHRAAEFLSCPGSL